MLAMGGEASLSKKVIEQIWGSIGEQDLECVVPKSDHWIGDENPLWVANYISSWFNKSKGEVSVVVLGVSVVT
jgi:hypothetical protein